MPVLADKVLVALMVATPVDDVVAVVAGYSQPLAALRELQEPATDTEAILAFVAESTTLIVKVHVTCIYICTNKVSTQRHMQCECGLQVWTGSGDRVWWGRQRYHSELRSGSQQQPL